MAPPSFSSAWRSSCSSRDPPASSCRSSEGAPARRPPVMIRNRLLRAAIASAVLLLAVALPASAHSGDAASGISVEPAQVTAGGTVVLAGNGLEPNSDRQINLVGPDVVVPFPTVTTDAQGMFAVTLTIPAHVPAGTYTFQAIGDETLTATCAVKAAAGVANAEPLNAAAETVT